MLIYECPGVLYTFNANNVAPEPVDKAPGVNNSANPTDPYDSNSASGTGENSAYQATLTADRHGATSPDANNNLIGSANFVLADGHAKYLRCSPERGGQGGVVSVGYTDGDSIANCVPPDQLNGTQYVATFCL